MDDLIHEEDNDNANHVTYKQREHIRMEYVYLRKAYEIVLQSMNRYPWV